MSEVLGNRLEANSLVDNDAAAVPSVTSIIDITDREVELFIPSNDVSHPEVSIVIPAVNEELTISDFVDWCMQGLAEAALQGEVLIVDSSTDRTAQIALERGARVLKTPKRGLGRAYIDAVPYIRGQYVVMGDADCTYDFRQLKPFVDRLREGYEFAMGSRWLGSIEPGSMPTLHRRIGTPVTTWILNWLYGSSFTDIHCGMRGISREALFRMGLSSQSWEYASEMVLKSVRMQLKTTEVPVTFYKDREGRVSHHKRSGWFSPFRAAWINLRAMFIYRADFFVLKPGLCMFVLGLLLTLPLTGGSIRIGAVTLSLYSMLFGLTLTVLGLESFLFGCLAQVFCDYGGASRRKWMTLFPYTQSVLTSLGLMACGLALVIGLGIHYVTHSFTLQPSSVLDHFAVTGILFIIMGFSLFGFTLVLHATGVRYGNSPASSPSQP
jgi:glycosyltransferase involved in cell wall biosynthesis